MGAEISDARKRDDKERGGRGEEGKGEGKDQAVGMVSGRKRDTKGGPSGTQRQSQDKASSGSETAINGSSSGGGGGTYIMLEKRLALAWGRTVLVIAVREGVMEVVNHWQVKGEAAGLVWLDKKVRGG